MIAIKKKHSVNVARNSTATWLMMLAVAAALFLGLLAVVFGNIANQHLGLLAALPATLVLGLLFAFNRSLLFLFIIMTRSFLDPVLNFTKAGGSTGLGGVLNALVIALALVALFSQPLPALRELRNTWGVLLLALLLSIGFSPAIWPSIKMNLIMLSYAAVFILPMFFIKNQVDFKRWMVVILWSALVPVLFGLYQKATGHGFHEGANLRIQGSFEHPNIFAFYLVLMISLLFTIYRGALIQVAGWVRMTIPFVILVMLGLLVLTKTRSAWAACFAFFLLYGVFMERRVLLPLLLLSLLALAVPEVRDRLTSLTTGNHRVMFEQLNSYAWRKLMWQSALHFMTRSHYLLGYGAGSFQFYSNQFFSLAGRSSPGAHSVYVQLLFETGGFGLLAFIALLVNMLLRAKRLFSRDPRIGFLLVSMIIAYTFYCYSDNVLDYLAFNWYFWFVIGALLGYLARLQPSESPHAA